MTTHHLYSKRSAAIAIAAAAVVAGVVAPTTSAEAGGRVATTGGACSARGTWDMKASAEAPGRLAVEFSVDTNRAGQRFNVRLLHNGKATMSVVRATRAPSGSFTIRNLVPNRAGGDHFRAQATRIGAANTCSGRVAF
jgi:hypothetical protein